MLKVIRAIVKNFPPYKKYALYSKTYFFPLLVHVHFFSQTNLILMSLKKCFFDLNQNASIIHYERQNRMWLRS